ncbi:hypothetical protein CHCC15337_0544 [Bacillus paralicheniformis]|nr:hypothetical protein CHCC5022_3322 [Bacillus paralicheniformis]TWJ83946.1 hypothetical protein CHCC4186_4195 [Bacillus paralicheniformis]TWL38488.1 hypothetical protein CHCC15337_0544 [Bacillus paralicheniformis]TWN61889.1 hypothetical protein CHCC14427_3712 [Bacillus paralicheniformis]
MIRQQRTINQNLQGSRTKRKRRQKLLTLRAAIQNRQHLQD